MARDELEKAISVFDGKNISCLSEARVKLRNSPRFIENLISLCFDNRPNMSDGATWILKAELENGTCLSVKSLKNISLSLEKLSSWQAKLHMCQIVERLDLTSEQAGQFIQWAHSFSDHARPFLRAWALSVRYILGNKFAEYQHEVELALSEAQKDKAASVQARMRQLQKASDTKNG